MPTPNVAAVQAPPAAPPADARDHPAARAWAELRPGGAAPTAIARLQQKRKAAVYRLAGVGRGGSGVVAKHSSRARIAAERAIYERVLPALPVPTVGYYGCVDEPDADGAWLFVEDAGDGSYAPDLAAHRALAARWLGLLHTAAAEQLPAAAAYLPDRGPGYYLEHLRAARDIILGTRHNPALTADDLAVLEAIVHQCGVAESHWDEVERLCDALPRTLIHGDFAPKNLRVRAGAGGPALLVFDWGSAGRGVAAADLVQGGAAARWDYWANPDLATYGAAVRGRWPGPGPGARELEPVAAVGKLFRCLVCVRLSAESFTTPWVERAARNMVIYRAEMADALREVGWTAGGES